jgi:integrase
MQKLTDVSVRNARARERPYKISDGHGLTLIVQPNGSKWWRMRYRLLRTEKMLSLGTYPEVTLREARDRALHCRRLLESGADPALERLNARDASERSFEFAARSWLVAQQKLVDSDRRADKTYKKAVWLLETFIFPEIGSRPISEITTKELLTTLKKIEEKGFYESARRAKQKCGQVFRHAVGLGFDCRDLTADLKGLLTPPVVKHHAALTDPAEIGELLLRIDGYTGRDATRLALQLAPLVFVRPLELRTAEWAVIDFEKAEWRIPAARMKMRMQHVVPLSRQAIEILEHAREISGDSPYVFPKLGYSDKPMCENAVNDALRILGYSRERMTGHGFRSIASTLLNELGFRPDAIERQLAHVEQDEVRGAYNYAQYLDERRTMMQRWADYLDSLRRHARARRESRGGGPCAIPTAPAEKPTRPRTRQRQAA